MVLSALLTNFEGMHDRTRGREEEEEELEKTHRSIESFKSPKTVRKTGKDWAGVMKSSKAGSGERAAEQSPALPRSEGKKPKAARKLREEESCDEEGEDDEYEHQIVLIEDDNGPD
eukprot:1098041-Rhodomonas_salina.1